MNKLAKQHKLKILQIFYQEVSMAIGGISTSVVNRSEVVDFGWPFIFSGLVLISHVPKPRPRWEAIYWPFQKAVWIAVVFSTAGVAILIWCLNKIGKSNSKFLDAIGLSVRVIFDEGMHYYPKFCSYLWISAPFADYFNLAFVSINNLAIPVYSWNKCLN